MEAAIALDTPAVGALVHHGGAKAVRAYVSGHIVALRDFINLRGAMTDDQTVATAELVVSEYGNLSLADIALIFRRAKLGQWGEFYGRLDGQIILGWFKKYYDERCEAFAQKSAYDGERFKGKDFQLPSKGDGARIVREVLALTKEKAAANSAPGN
jgi:hypothetical protein